MLNSKLHNSNEIVLVDDDEIDTRFIRNCLELSCLNNHFVSFESGFEFLAYMDRVRYREEPMPAIILLDINMPGMNGFEVVNELRKHPEFHSRPPIILLTTSDSPNDKQRASSMNLDFSEKFLNRSDAIQFLESLV